MYYFFVYNLGGLFHILNKKYDIQVPNTSELLEDKSKNVSKPTTEITFPIKIYMKYILPFQREAFEIIKDKFELIEDLKTIQDYEIVSIYGASCETNQICDNPQDIFPFIRNIFLEKCKYKLIKGKRIFITKKNSESQHNNNTLHRCILNENEMMDMLKKYNFEYIQLEDYNTNDKIKLFMESEIILSTHGSQLTFALFSNKEAKIIEFHNYDVNAIKNHYKYICNTLNLNYNRYSNINEDIYGNFNLNVIEFEKYLLTLI
jgi:hypothetical protein